MKIKYKNVCSIRNAEVEFKPGNLVCIKGESNQGKSALFYALVDGLTNSPAYKKWINNQALAEDPKATAWIGLTDDENNLFQVEAGTGHFNYRVNDVKYEKVARKNLFELIEGQIPGLLYDPNDTRQIMNVQGEDDGLFPIDRSDAQIFKTYERLLSLSCTEDILRTIKLDMEDIDYKILDMTKSVQQQQSQLSKIDEFFDNIDLEKLKTDQDTLVQLQEKYERLHKLYEDTEKVAMYVSEVNKVDKLDNKTFDTKKFEQQLTKLIKANNDIKYINLCQTKFSTETYDVKKFENIVDKVTLAQKLINDIDILNAYIKEDSEKLQSINSILDEIKICPYCNRPIEEE
jgi:ABC-type lipopolysaccharide export system ATPase subunit